MRETFEATIFAGFRPGTAPRFIGEGQLPKAGQEQILEMYYDLGAFSFANVTLDYQFVNNPAYNQQRGPVSVIAARVHVAF